MSGTGECTCACVGYELCHLTVDLILPEYYHGFKERVPEEEIL